MAKFHPQSALRYPLSVILAAEARVSVLRELSRHGAELSAPQLVARTGHAQSSVREALISLGESQTVDVLGAGKSILYRINRRHPLESVLGAMFAAEEDRFSAIMEGIRETVDGLKDKVDALWLFGSVTRGEDVFSSDLDMAVVIRDLDDGEVVHLIRERIRPLEEKYVFRASIIALTQDDISRLETTNPPLLRSFESDGVTIFGQRPMELLRDLKTRLHTEPSV